MTSHYRYHLKHRFTCVECGQTFSTESYMYKHRDTHSGIRPYVCTDCGKTYLSTSHLNKHRRAAHSTLRPYQCSYCGKCYKGKDQLTYHENSHRGEKPYQCSVCGYATAYRHTYYVHKKKHLKPSLGDQNANQDDGLSSVVKDRKPIRKQAEGDGDATKTSTLRKVKSRVTVSTNKKQLGKVVECQVESVPTVVSQCTSVGGSKDGNESSFASSSLPLSVIYVVSAGGGVNGVVQQQQLTLPVKDGSNAILIQSGGDGQDVSLPSCVQSGSNHQTLVHPQDGTHQTLVHPQDGTHQTLVNHQDGTHQTLVHPQDGTHQTLVHPQDGTHQTLVNHQDGTHQAFVHPQGGTHQASFTPGRYSPAFVHPQDGTHQTLVHPQDGTHQTLVNHQDGTHQTLVHPQDGTQQMLVHPQVVKTTFPTNNLLENNRLESFKPSDKDVNASSEKQESCIFLSSTGKCAVPSCDSRDDSLMLLKVSDNSYVGICGHHAFTEGSGDGLRQLGAIDVQPLAAVNVQTEYDVKTLHLVTPGSTELSTRRTIWSPR
ncbi:transcription factor E4F1-like [Homarus americanus]|uniref:transcription factor E4F1-like n=1 Tax=Homarus americanus TaxID=6706 RepID=UPI001C48861B|nr:transcription factor E4F1-like [Homarus americanus]